MTAPNNLAHARQVSDAVLHALAPDVLVIEGAPLEERRTLEQRLKFDHGLPIGRSLVRFTLGECERLALVEISPRGKVSYLAKPEPGDMYSSWSVAKGDTATSSGAIIVWGARSPDVMALFDGAPVASIPVVQP